MTNFAGPLRPTAKRAIYRRPAFSVVIGTGAYFHLKTRKEWPKTNSGVPPVMINTAAASSGESALCPGDWHGHAINMFAPGPRAGKIARKWNTRRTDVMSEIHWGASIPSFPGRGVTQAERDQLAAIRLNLNWRRSNSPRHRLAKKGVILKQELTHKSPPIIKRKARLKLDQGTGHGKSKSRHCHILLR